MKFAGVPISARNVQRIALEVGTELACERDQKAAKGRRKVPVRVAATPEVVAVEVDGGRLRTRAPDEERGVHDKKNKEDKVACLVTLKSEVHAEDPTPEPPEKFLEPRRVQRLVQQMQGMSGDQPQEQLQQGDTPDPEPVSPEEETHEEGPRKHVRTCVASMGESAAFGPMVAAEAQERDFYRAERRAFVGDGAAYNWSIQKKHFADFVAKADFLHVLC